MNRLRSRLVNEVPGTLWQRWTLWRLVKGASRAGDGVPVPGVLGGREGARLEGGGLEDTEEMVCFHDVLPN